MKYLFYITLLMMLAGCGSLPERDSDSYQQSVEKRELNRLVSQWIVNSPTFAKLKAGTKNWDYIVGIPDGDWVWVDIGGVTTPFFHRWATLKVNTKTGKILKLIPDSVERDEFWAVEYDPPK